MWDAGYDVDVIFDSANFQQHTFLRKDPMALDQKELSQSYLATFARSNLNGSELAISATLTMLAH